MERVVPQLPGAGEALRSLANLVLIVAGITAYATLALTLVPNLALVGTASTLVLFASIAVWCCGFLPAFAAERAGIQCYALVGLLAAPYVLSTTCLLPWIDMGLIGISAILGAVIAMPLPRALWVIGYVVALDIAQIYLPRPTVAISDNSLPVIGLWAGPAFLLVAGVGLAIWRNNWAASAKATDDEFVSAQQALLNGRRDQSVLAAQHQSQRRLHETMLNTLFAVGSGVGRTNRSLVQQTCKSDLGHLDPGSRYVTAVAVETVALDAADVMQGQLLVEILGEADVQVSAIAAGALRDAIVEALRNVLRHAHATRAEIHLFQGGASVFVRIVDHGVGFSRVADQRFGLKQAIQEPIEILGGSVRVTSEPGEGTEVELTVPIEAVIVEPETGPPVLNVVVGPRSARLAAISPVYFGLATVGMVCTLYAHWWILLSAYLVFAACVIAGALWWDSWFMRPLAILTFVALAITFLVLLIPALHENHSAGHDEAGTITFYWLVNAGFVATVIAMLALPPRVYAWLPLSLPFAAAALIIMKSAETSSMDRFASLVQALAFMGLTVYAVTTIFKAIEVQRGQALATWSRVHDLETRTQEEFHWDNTIRGVPDSVVSLVSGIASGELDPGDEGVIAAAREQERVLRWYLLEMRERGSERPASLRPIGRRQIAELMPPSRFSAEPVT
ncbi:MAG: hypothetical protein Q8M73_12550 [Actinomycetota bacterium]|nr:hypothetical protein [Actinomycetota bacterium]